MTPEQRDDYEREKRYHHDRKMQKYTAELKAKKEGEAIGLEKGEAIGLEKGEAIGIEKERQKAHQEKITAALEMLSDGMPIEKIAKYTGLSINEIEKL